MFFGQIFGEGGWANSLFICRPPTPPCQGGARVQRSISCSRNHQRNGNGNFPFIGWFTERSTQRYQSLRLIGQRIRLGHTRCSALDDLGRLTPAPGQEALDCLDGVDNLLLGHAFNTAAMLDLKLARDQ